MGRAAAAQKFLMMVVVIGYVILWVMIPTNTWRQKWQPLLRSKLNNSTFFGNQGTNLMVFTAPVLFVAAWGCVYIHLLKKSNDITESKSINGSKMKNDSLAMWNKPMLVKGPLGIVSGIELAFFIMFLALIIWSLSTFLHNSFAQITPESAAKNGEKVWQGRLDSAALRLGLVGNICLTLLFFPVARGSSVLQLFGLTLEASIKYHIWLGHMVMALFTAHGLAYVVYWASTDQISMMLEWSKTDVSNVAGEIALVAGLFLWVTTIPRIRRAMFELFFYTHHLYIIFVGFFFLHVGISYAGYMLPGFFLFLVDRFLRFLQSRQKVPLISSRILPCETVELNFSKTPGLTYNPASILFINVPSISKMQWHPFTISSNSNLEPDRLSVVVKSEGIWSKKLYKILSSATSIDRPVVSVEGPYGPASTHLLRYETLFLVSGGSGITPFVSIIRELIFISTTQKSKTPQVVLVCAFKNSFGLTMLDLLLPASGTPSQLSNLQLKIEAYVTREKEPVSHNNSNLHRAIWFKPLPTDAPISPILGQNSWLWLGAVIISSFGIFLVIIGLVTRYYIYPIDHNTNEVFALGLRAFLNMLAICISIAIAASGAVYWNKKQNAREGKQIQNMEGSTPSGSPGDSELESLPHQSLMQAITVHYGQRPDIKSILLECKGSSVGVLASGPKKLRHDVATICSTGLVDNVHFESISFSW